MGQLTSGGQTARRWIKCISFLLIFVVLLVVFSDLLMPKNNDSHSGMTNHNARGFYGEPKDSLDIIGIGNSNLAAGFSPMELWKEYGYTGYNCSESGQNIFQAYNALSEVMTCQKPKVVVLDADGIFPAGGGVDTFNKFMHFTLARFFPVIENHNLWKTLPLRDWTKAPSYTWTSPTKGFWPSGLKAPLSGGRIPENKPAGDCLSIESMFQLKALQALCQKHDTHLVLVYYPTAFSWDQKRHDLIAKYAAAHQVPFLDFNTNPPLVQLDWGIDTRDGGVHLNSLGARKITVYIGSYLHQHDLVRGHHGDAIAVQWNREYKNYQKYIQ